MTAFPVRKPGTPPFGIQSTPPDDGFFIYGVYILIVNILYNRGKIRDKGAYGRFTAGGGSSLERLRRMEAAVDEFEGWLLRWYRQEISDEAFVDALKHISLTREDY